MLGALILGCIAPQADDSGPVQDYDGPTTIASVATECSTEDDTWTIQIETVGWTSGGLLSMATDGRRVEAHPLVSVEADAAMRWDRLQLDLAIQADPRDVAAGTRTAWLCSDADALAWRVMVQDPISRDNADCVVWGQPLDWNAAAGYSDCPTMQDP